MRFVLLAIIIFIAWYIWWYKPRKRWTISCAAGKHSRCDDRDCGCPHHCDGGDRCTCVSCAEFVRFSPGGYIDLTELEPDEFAAARYPYGWDVFRPKIPTYGVEVLRIEREEP